MFCFLFYTHLKLVRLSRPLKLAVNDIAADADLSFILTILTLNLNQKCLCVLHAWQTDQHLQSDQSDQLHQAIAYLFR